LTAAAALLAQAGGEDGESDGRSGGGGCGGGRGIGPDQRPPVAGEKRRRVATSRW
jgi:hypothetical protein